MLRVIGMSASGRKRGATFERYLLAMASGLAALHCNTFDDPPRKGDFTAPEPRPAFPREDDHTTAGSTTSAPPVVTTLPPVPPPPSPTTFPGAIDGGLREETTGATSNETMEPGDTGSSKATPSDIASSALDGGVDAGETDGETQGQSTSSDGATSEDAGGHTDVSPTTDILEP